MSEQPFKFTCTCAGCGQERDGVLYFDERMKLVDSDGGMLFGDGWRCHLCLGESW